MFREGSDGHKTCCVCVTRFVCVTRLCCVCHKTCVTRLVRTRATPRSHHYPVVPVPEISDKEKQNAAIQNPIRNSLPFPSAWHTNPKRPINCLWRLAVPGPVLCNRETRFFFDLLDSKLKLPATHTASKRTLLFASRRRIHGNSGSRSKRSSIRSFFVQLEGAMLILSLAISSPAAPRTAPRLSASSGVSRRLAVRRLRASYTVALFTQSCEVPLPNYESSISNQGTKSEAQIPRDQSSAR